MEELVYRNLKQIVNQYWLNTNLEHCYSNRRYSVPTNNCPVSEQLKEEINNCETNLEKNLLLKKRLTDEMDEGENKAVNFWIIQRWGGISSMKDTDRNQRRIAKFLERLNKESLCLRGEPIASFSKVASFAYPHRYFIYDSRVSYSLNWLLREARATTGFFPLLSGRNGKLVHCHLKEVLRKENREFENSETAYCCYCKLLLRLYNDICPNGNEPYKLEMLLFMIAPEGIYNAFKTEFQGTEFFEEDK